MGSKMQNSRNLFNGKVVTIIRERKLWPIQRRWPCTVNSSNSPVLDRMRKDIISILKNEGLSVTIETNLIETDFFDA